MTKVFLSYSHKDEELHEEFIEHLGALKHEKIIETWWDRKIPLGTTWNDEIAHQLDAADLIVLFVSPAFLDSAYCYEKELRRAIERHDAGKALVVPIIVRPCHWQPAPFAKLQGLPKDMTPVTAAPEHKRDQIWTEIAQAIHQAAMMFGSHKHAGAREHGAPPTVNLTGVLSIDEAQLDAIIEQFEEGANVAIKWPKSSDQLIFLAQEVVKKFDETHISSVGSEEFIRSAPGAISDAFRSRAKCERRLPELMHIMIQFGQFKDRPDLRDFYRQCRTDAIKFYLLLSNYFAHWKLGYLSSWQGLNSLDMQAPEAWIPYQGMPSDKFIPLLLDERGNNRTVGNMRLSQIGEYRITSAGSPDYIYILIPEAYLCCDENGWPRFIGDEKIICRWAIPQVELSEQLRCALPNSYNGKWRGFIPRR
jgi:TIR domain